MRKNIIYVTPPVPGRPLSLSFYYRSDGEAQFLFSYPYRKCIYRYFSGGKSPHQLVKTKDWLRNRTLTNLMEGKLRKSMTKYWGRDGKEGLHV